MRVTVCNYCGKDAVLVGGRKLYPKKPALYKRRFWMCAPCGAWVGTHKDDNKTPFGPLANARLRSLRRRAHLYFDKLWQGKDKMDRRIAYVWLAGRLGISGKKCHIGNFDERMCQRVIDECREYFGGLEVEDKA